MVGQCLSIVGRCLGETMGNSPEAAVRQLLGLWGDPQAQRFAAIFSDDVIWIDGPNGVHRGSAAVVEELIRQLSMFPGQWMEIDALVASGKTVMVEWHGGFSARGTTIHTKVMARFEIDPDGRIAQMHESYDMNSLVQQLGAAGFQISG